MVMVGAGLTGTYMASELVQKGYRVVLIDRSMDLGFPPAGSCFIALETYDKFLKNYENNVNGIFPSIIISGDNYEEEIKLDPRNAIVSMDREKLVRNMAYNFSNSGGKLMIASTIKWVKGDEGRKRVGWIREGKTEEITCDRIIFNTGKVDEQFIFHSSQCKRKTLTAHYTRFIPENRTEYFSITPSVDHLDLSCSNGFHGEELNISSSPVKRNTVSSISYNLENHSCFPISSDAIFAGGSIMGSDNYLGRGIDFSLTFNSKMTELMDLEWNEVNRKMEKTFIDMDKSRGSREKDILETILFKIPILS